MKHLAAFCLGLMLLIPAGAQAADPSLVGELEPGMIDSIGNRALENIHLGQCAPERNCQPATEAERRRGVISGNMTADAIRRGAGSAFADHCGFEWGERSYLPLMEREQNSGCWNPRQLALISVTHGLAMALFRDELKSEGHICDPATQERVEAYLLKIGGMTRRNDCRE